MTHGEHPDWTTSALERARYLDGEGTPDERAARAADLLRDPAARARMDADARFLAVVRAAAPAAAVRPSDLLEARVRRALAADRAAGFPSTGAGDARRARRRVFAVAATLAAVAFGSLWWASSDRVPTSEAVFDPVKAAAEAYRDAKVGVLPVDARPGGTCDDGPASPHRFPLVTSGEVSVEGCREQGDASVAVLRRNDTGQAEKGFVVVPADGKSEATDVGFTRVEDLVVFDVTIGRMTYYLASPYAAVAGTPMCAACHGPARADRPERNPHRFFERAPATLRSTGR